MTKQDYINEYTKILRIKKLGINTQVTYLKCLDVFLSYCESNDIFPPEITKPQLRDFLSGIKSNSYLKQQRGTIDNFYRYVLSIPYVMADMPFPKKQKSLPDYFSIHELQAIFNSVKNPKQRLLLKIQYALALRVHELVKLKWSDFVYNFGKYDLKILGKGNKHDFIPVPDDTINEIIEVLGNGFGRNEYLFTGQFGGHYSERSVQQIINRAIEQNKIVKEGSTHLLRHSRATHLIQSGVSLRHVQLLLRHSSSKTTEIYTHLDKNDLRQAFISVDVKLNLLLTNHNETLIHAKI